MMEELAKVVSCSEGWIQVEVELKSACNHCSSEESCGTSAVAKAFSSKTQVFSLPHDKSYPSGDMIKIGLPESVILKAAALVYLMPLIGFFIGGGVASAVNTLFTIESESAVIIAALLGGVSAWYLARKRAKQLESEATPVVIAHLGSEISLHRATP